MRCKKKQNFRAQSTHTHKLKNINISSNWSNFLPKCCQPHRHLVMGFDSVYSNLWWLAHFCEFIFAKPSAAVLTAMCVTSAGSSLSCSSSDFIECRKWKITVDHPSLGRLCNRARHKLYPNTDAPTNAHVHHQIDTDTCCPEHKQGWSHWMAISPHYVKDVFLPLKCLLSFLEL